tara:strand:- start:243 stop:353 length:111 start_codon:yes stop_codon:yes gene_type:complete
MAEDKVMIDFLVDVAALSTAIFVGSIAYDWWRKKNR